MSRIALGLATLATIAASAAAQSAPSLVEELTAVYTARSKSEVQALAKQLDVMNAAVIARMPSGNEQSVPTAPSVREALKLAWEYSGRAITVFETLLESPRKFTRWATEEKLPAWFGVPDSVAQVRRWEALRPILAPIASGERLGWDREDAPEWKAQYGAWRLELLLLLKWLGPEAPPIPPGVRSEATKWAAAQAGIDLVRKWRESPGDNYQMLHREYHYTVLPPPSRGSSLPKKLNAMLTRLSWGGKGDIRSFLGEKEALAADLLAGFESNRVEVDSHTETATNSVCANTPTAVTERVASLIAPDAEEIWFDAAARSFPPFSAFEPEWDADHATFRSVHTRRDPALRRSLDALRLAGASHPLSASVLWYPSVMTQSGKLKLPVAGWSSWVPEQLPAQKSIPTPVQIAAQAPRVSPAEGVWHQICAWIAQTLAKDVGAQPILLSIRNRSGWAFAFRPEELEEVSGALAIPLVYANSTTGSRGTPPLNVELSIVRVTPDRSIGVELRIDRKLVGAADFSIPGPWPSWIATRRIPTIKSFSLWLALIALGAFAWHLIRWQPATRIDRQRKFVTTFAAVAGLMIALAAMFDGPEPAPSPELGGVVELALPLDDAAPQGMRMVVASVSSKIYKSLSELTEDDQRPGRAMSFGQRWWYAFRRLLGGGADPRVAVQRDAITQLAFQIVPAVFERDKPVAAGQIHASGIPAFEELLRNLVYSGEPELSASLVNGNQPGTRLVVNLSHADHGAVQRPAALDAQVRPSNILSVELLTPTRDIREGHGLLVNLRRNWLRGHSTRTVALQGGFPDSLRASLSPPPVPADVSACQPEDLEQIRTQWWNNWGVASPSLESASSEIATRAVEMLRQPDAVFPAGSHTILRLSRSWLVFWMFLTALVLLAFAYHLGTEGGSWGHWHVLRALALETCVVPLVSLTVLLPLFSSVFSPSAWSYGDGLLDSVAPVRWWVVGFLLSALAVRITIVWAEKRWSPHVGPPPEYVISVRTWLARAGGSLGLALSFMFWISAPIRDFGSGPWLPSDYSGTVMAGLVFWFGGVYLLTATRESQE